MEIQRPEEAEPTTSFPPRAPRTYHYSRPARHGKRAVQEPSKHSFAAELSAVGTQLMHFAIDYITSQYRYLQGALKNHAARVLHAARKAHRAAQKPSKISYASQLTAVRTQLMKGVQVAVDRTTRTWRHLQAVRGYDEPLPKHADTMTYIRYLWRRVLLGFWPEKLTFGIVFVIWGCVLPRWRSNVA